MVSNAVSYVEPVKKKAQKTNFHRFAIRWGGAAGDGLQSAGNLFQKFLNRLGYYVCGFPGTQSTIRGGHIWQHVEFSSKPLLSFNRPLDLLVAISRETLDVHLRDLKNNRWLLYNSDKIKLNEFQTEITERNIMTFELPMLSLAKEIDRKKPVLANSVIAGAIIEFLRLNKSHYEKTLKKHFTKKENTLTMNLEALRLGGEYFNKNHNVNLSLTAPKLEPKKNFLISGNEMIALGAAASGLKFLAQYPITPASSILSYLVNRARKFGIVVRQAEDELAALTMCIGASFAGARAMTASSGPGLSLMSESLGYAAMTETPVVIINSMRAGPSTGIPTKMEQADFASMIYISHGESPRAVLAPRNIKECFEITSRAFNIADRFQLPVIVLSDFALSETTFNIEPFDFEVPIDRGKIWDGPTEEYPIFKRNQFTEDGISPRAFPPTEGGEYILVGAEHDEFSNSLSGNRCGIPSSWKIREKMFEKRFRKLELLRQEMNPPLQYGLENADHTILSWGSTQGAIQEAVDHLNLVGGDSWNMLSFADLFPLPYKKIQPLLTDIKHSIMYEVNWTGQLENLIHHHLDWRADNRIHPLSGETPTSSSIINEIKECFDFL